MHQQQQYMHGKPWLSYFSSRGTPRIIGTTIEMNYPVDWVFAEIPSDFSK